jgi:hypothetical protein
VHAVLRRRRHARSEPVAPRTAVPYQAPARVALPPAPPPLFLPAPASVETSVGVSVGSSVDLSAEVRAIKHSCGVSCWGVIGVPAIKHRARRQLRARPLRMCRRGARRLVGPHVVRPTVEGRRPGVARFSSRAAGAFVPYRMHASEDEQGVEVSTLHPTPPYRASPRRARGDEHALLEYVQGLAVGLALRRAGAGHSLVGGLAYA